MSHILLSIKARNCGLGDKMKRFSFKFFISKKVNTIIKFIESDKNFISVFSNMTSDFDALALLLHE